MNRRRDARQSAQRVALSGLLVALMLVLGYVESLIPSPVPGIKLGLSNSILIFAVYMLDIPTAYCLMMLKVLLSGMMFGGVSAIAYAFAGGLLSLTGMCLTYRVRGVHPVVVSLIGGVLHNVGQIAMSMLIIRTNLLWYLGVLMLTGCVFGALTGLCATTVMRHLRSIGWKQSERKRGSALLVLLAVILCGVLCFMSWNTLREQKQASQNVTITVSSTTQSDLATQTDPMVNLLNERPKK